MSPRWPSRRWAPGAGGWTGRRSVRPSTGTWTSCRYAWPVGRTRLRKAAYFATAAGAPTGFEYVEGSYGPFTPDLATARTRLLNNGVLTEASLGRMLAVRPGPTFEDARARNEGVMAAQEDTIQRVTDLLIRLDSRHTEIATSVHFASRALASELRRRPSEREVLDRVLRWKQHRRPPLVARDVVHAIRGLAAIGWIDVTRSSDLPPEDEAATVA